MERFKNEAQVMAKFIHPGIVAVHDFGETAEGQLYIVMEFVDGTDVAQMITAQGRLPPEHALAIAAHVCDALSYAHSHGVIHRDIKPANILINREGAVKVADFGLAKVDEPGTTGLTKTGMAMGTPDYVAPEALMFGTQVDARADLYAIGVMLYHMLTGEIPRGSFDLPSRRIGTDPRFDAIILKAMKMDREERYQSSSAIRQDLDAILTMPLVQAGGESSAAIPQRSTNCQVREEAPVSRSPASNHQSKIINHKSSMITLAATAAVLATGAFLVLKPSSQPPATSSGTTAASRSDESGVAATAHQDASRQPGTPSSAAASWSAVAERPAPVASTTPLSPAPTPANNAKPILLAQANTSPKLSPTESQSQFVGEWFGEDDPKGARVVIYADGRVELWRNGKQDQRPNGTFWWTDWKWRMNGADLEILNGDKDVIYQTWKKSGADTVLASEKGTTVNKKRSKDFWSSVNGAPSTITQPPAAPSTPPAAPAPPAVTLPPELTTLQQQYDKLLAERVTGIYDADVAKLNTGYLAGLDRAAATAQSAGELDTVLAIQEEKKLIAAKQPVPATDDAKTPEALKNLRTIFRTSLAKLDEQRTTNHAALVTPYATRLKQIEADLTKAGRITDAVAVKKYREGLGTNPVPTAPVVAATPAAATMPMKEKAPPAPTAEMKLPKGDDRAAAEWVIGMGGEVQLRGGNTHLKQLAELPKGRFEVSHIFILKGTKAVQDAEFDRLANLQALTNFHCATLPDQKDAALRFLATCPKLATVDVQNCVSLTGDWLRYLTSAHNLSGLWVVSAAKAEVSGLADLSADNIQALHCRSVPLDDAALAAISRFKNLRTLGLRKTKVTGQGISALVSLTNLELLDLSETAVTAESLLPIAKLPLTELGFGRTAGDLAVSAPELGRLFPKLERIVLPPGKLSSANLAVLGSAWPKLKTLSTASFTQFDEDTFNSIGEILPALEVLDLWKTKVTDAQLTGVAQLKKLIHLGLADTAVTDSTLPVLQTMKSLKSLALDKTSVTDAAIAAFKKARPDVKVTK
jgi:serine/threonine protein kinase